MTDVFSSEVLRRALELKDEGYPWSTISARLGVGEMGLKARLVPKFVANKKRAPKRPKTALPRLVNVHAKAEALPLPPADTRSRVARWMGDPLPGRSALDRRTYTERGGKLSLLSTARPEPEYIEDRPNTGTVVYG